MSEVFFTRNNNYLPVLQLQTNQIRMTSSSGNRISTQTKNKFDDSNTLVFQHRYFWENAHLHSYYFENDGEAKLVLISIITVCSQLQFRIQCAFT